MGGGKSLAVVLSALCSLVTCAAGPYGPFVFPNKAGLAVFDAAKFGLFVHWGPVSQCEDRGSSVKTARTPRYLCEPPVDFLPHRPQSCS